MGGNAIRSPALKGFRRRTAGALGCSFSISMHQEFESEKSIGAKRSMWEEKQKCFKQLLSPPRVPSFTISSPQGPARSSREGLSAQSGMQVHCGEAGWLPARG